MNVWRGPAETGQMTSPQAVRLRVSRWRDPRLLVGLLLVLGAAIGGARLVAASDHTEEYWAVSQQVQAGDPVVESQFDVVRVRLTGESQSRYLRTDDEFSAELAALEWAVDASPGMLVSEASFGDADSAATSEFPLLVASGSMPADLARGDTVDVWVAPENEADADAARVLAHVRVLSSGEDPSAVGGSLTRTVLIDAGATDVDGAVVAAVASGHVTLIRVG